MNSKETELVTEEFCNRSDTYNLHEGGYGGWFHVNKNEVTKNNYRRKGMKTFLEKTTEEISEINKKKAHHREKNYWYGKNRSKENNPRYNATVTEEIRRKISLGNTGKSHSEEFKVNTSNRLKQQWKTEEYIKKMKNRNKPDPKKISEQQKGLLWWTNGEETKKSRVKPEGINWIRGRTKNGI